MSLYSMKDSAQPSISAYKYISSYINITFNFQNNVTAMDDVVYDESGFFVVADYIEHIKSCTG